MEEELINVGEKTSCHLWESREQMSSKWKVWKQQGWSLTSTNCWNRVFLCEMSWYFFQGSSKLRLVEEKTMIKKSGWVIRKGFLFKRFSDYSSTVKGYQVLASANSSVSLGIKKNRADPLSKGKCPLGSRSLPGDSEEMGHSISQSVSYWLWVTELFGMICKNASFSLLPRIRGEGVTAEIYLTIPAVVVF